MTLTVLFSSISNVVKTAFSAYLFFLLDIGSSCQQQLADFGVALFCRDVNRRLKSLGVKEFSLRHSS
jgi:hypothetical protein